MKRIKYIIFIAVSLFLFSCGGGGGNSDTENPINNPIPSPQPKFTFVYAMGITGPVGFQMEFSITGNINPASLTVEKGDIIKNWTIEKKIVNGKLRILAFDEELKPVFSTKKVELLKISVPDGVKITKVSEKFVNDTGVPIKVQTIVE